MKAKDTIVVGDMPVDIIMGRNAGTFTCGVTYGNASKRQLIDAHADYIIEDLSQLLKII